MWRLWCHFLNQIYLKCKIGSANIPVFWEDCCLPYRPTQRKKRGKKFTSPFKLSTLHEGGNCSSQETDRVQGDGERSPRVAIPDATPGKPSAASDWHMPQPPFLFSAKELG